MEKAWDLKILKEELQAKGLPAIEGVAELAIEAVYGFVKKSCELETNVLIKGIAASANEALLGPEGLVKKAADKIDGQEG